MAKTNTTDTVNSPRAVTKAELDAEIRKAGEYFEKERKVKVSIPKGFQKRLGSELPIGINGAVIVLPVDGSTHEIPESFADILRESLADLE